MMKLGGGSKVLQKSCTLCLVGDGVPHPLS